MTSTHDWQPAHEIADAIRRGERKATELLDEALAAIDRLDPVLNAWVELDVDQAREVARAVDETVARGEDPGPLAGVPLGVKDLEAMAGLPTREGSLLFRDAPPEEHDSVHVARLRAAGAVPIGKTTVPEFGLTAQTTTKGYGVTRNPWDASATPGGSSGGSAAAVASGMLPLATASDGGGSIRIPAAFTGLVGLKPSHGRIPYPRPGDQSVLGALAVSVVDIARHLDVAAGPHDTDHQSLPAPSVRYEDAIQSLDLSGVRAAWSVDLGWATVDPEIAEATEDAVRQVAAAAGLRLVDRPVHLPNAAATWPLLVADGFLRRLSHLNVWPDHAEDLDDVTRSVIEIREHLRPEHLFRADERRRRTIAAVADVFADVDVLFTPTTAMTAVPAVGPAPETIGDQDARLSGPVPFTAFVNYAWNPAVAVPVGIAQNGLPISLQIVGPRHADEVPLRLARLLELERPWQRRPRSIEPPRPSAPMETESPIVSPDVLARIFEWATDLSHDATHLDERLVAELSELATREHADPTRADP